LRKKGAMEIRRFHSHNPDNNFVHR
jgi:hypothetical protein